MEAIKLYCIQKVRNPSGTIVEYIMSDELGDKGSFDRKGVVQLIRDRKYNVVNLQLDKLGRVVDKAIPNEAKIVDGISKRSQSNSTEAIFDRAYGFIQKMGMVMIVRDAAGHVKLTEPFDSLQGNINIDELQKRFEQYVLDKYHTALTKIDILNTADGSRFIQYGKEYVEYSILNTEDFKKIDSVKNFRFSCHADTKIHKCKRKVDRVFDKKTGKVFDDAFLGVIVYDGNCKDAVNWAQKRLKDLDRKVMTMKRE